MIKLSEKQQEIINSNARVKFILGGHRSGKTTLAIMAAWNMMGKNIFRPCVLFLVPTIPMRRCTTQDICHLLKEHIISTEKVSDNYGDYDLLNTVRGQIIVSDHMFAEPFGGYVFDNASSSKHVHPDNLKRLDNSFVYMTGHCPDDIYNAFFLMWLKAYFSDEPEYKAFRISSDDSPTMAETLKKYESMVPGGSKFNRGYMCIPDFLDRVASIEYDQRIYFEGRNPVEFNAKFLGKW